MIISCNRLKTCGFQLVQLILVSWSDDKKLPSGADAIG